jgi:hypothetical protein
LLTRFIEKGEISKAEKLLQEYIRMNLRIWEHGIYERSFNFTLNNGVDKDGNIVFVDLGEFSDDYHALARCLTEKSWMKCWSVEYDLDKDLRNYYLHEAGRKFTLDNLELKECLTRSGSRRLRDNLMDSPAELRKHQ